MAFVRWLLSISLLTLLCCVRAQGAERQMSAQQAAAHVGENAEVCGVVASANHAKRSRGQPTFLNLDEPYPDHVFTIVIWGAQRRNFAYAPESLQDQRICVTGLITIYKSKLQIEVSSPASIRMQGKKSVPPPEVGTVPNAKRPGKTRYASLRDGRAAV